MRVDASSPLGGCLLAIRRSPRNRISIGTVITGLRFGFVVILNDLFAHGHLLQPPLRREERPRDNYYGEFARHPRQPLRPSFFPSNARCLLFLSPFLLLELFSSYYFSPARPVATSNLSPLKRRKGAGKFDELPRCRTVYRDRSLLASNCHPLSAQ